MMIQLIFIHLLISCCSAINNQSRGYDFGQYYSRVRIFEYTDYSDMKFLKFNIDGPTTAAIWSIAITTESKCGNYLGDFHFDLQYGAYPLISPRNESFPDMYITTRHDLIHTKFNQTVSNGTVQLNNPLQGTWFAMAYLEHLANNGKSKSSSAGCNYYLTTWLDYQAVLIPFIFTLNEPLQIVLPNNTASVYASYFTSRGDSRLNILSNLSSICDIIILIRMNSLPNSLQYDYRTVCANGSCAFELDQFAGFIWIYFQISVDRLSCRATPISGVMLVHSSECFFSSNNRCIQSEPMRRIMLNSYYDFQYVTLSTMNSTNVIVFNANNRSTYAYEFVVDDRNLGGTLHLHFATQIIRSISNANILGCLSKSRPRPYATCENDYQILLTNNSLTTRSLPYPEMALWYLTLQFNCNDSDIECANTSISLIFQISSSACTQDQCGTYGNCRILTSQQNIFSTCICFADYRGYGCTDSSQAHLSKYLSNVLFLTLSNLMFIPAVLLAVYYGLYIEALVYFFNMFFSTFYHACDQAIFNYCLFKYDGLQLSDFIGSYASFVITLISMAMIPRAVKVFLFVFGVLICVVINSRDRFDKVQSILLLTIPFGLTILSWIVVSIKRRRLHPSRRELALLSPGFVLAIIGLILFAFVSTDENYWYTHSLWHMLMAMSILFLIPRHGKGHKERNQRSIKPNADTAGLPIGIINPGAVVPRDTLS